MTDALPPAPPAQKSGAAKWIIGCGLGCLVLIIIAVVAVVGMTYYAMHLGNAELKSTFARTYNSLKSEGKVPPEHQALFDELTTLATQPDASLMASSIGFGASMNALKDGQITPEELKQVTDVTDLIRQNPDISFVQAGKFFESHPELQAVFEQIQKDPKSLETMVGKTPAEPKESLAEAGPTAEPSAAEPTAPAAPATAP